MQIYERNPIEKKFSEVSIKVWAENSLGIEKLLK